MIVLKVIGHFRGNLGRFKVKYGIIFNVAVLSPLKVVGDKRPSGKATILNNTSNAYMFLKYSVGTLKCIQ